MKIKTSNEAVHAAAAASLQKQIYASPLLRVYGALHQFTQGTGGTATDAMVMATKM